MFSRCSLDVLRMFAGFFQDVFRMLRWVLWAWWNLMIISNESMDFNDPKEFDDPRLPDDPSYSIIPAIHWSPALRWSPAIWWSIGSIDFDNPTVYGDTSITDGLVNNYYWLMIDKCTVDLFDSWLTRLRRGRLALQVGEQCERQHRGERTSTSWFLLLILLLLLILINSTINVTTNPKQVRNLPESFFSDQLPEEEDLEVSCKEIGKEKEKQRWRYFMIWRREADVEIFQDF